MSLEQRKKEKILLNEIGERGRKLFINVLIGIKRLMRANIDIIVILWKGLMLSFLWIKSDNKKSVIVFMGVVVGTALLDVVIFKDAFNISFSKFNLVLRFILRNVVEIGLMSIGGGVGYVLAKVNKDNQLI